MDTLLDSSLPAELASILTLSEQVEAALAPLPRQAFAVNLCLEELVTNTVKHGVNGAHGHRIRVRIERSDRCLEILYSDEAPPFNPFEQAPEPDTALDIDQRPVGGLGVHLVRQLMDRVAWEGRPALGGNRIRLQLNLPLDD